MELYMSEYMEGGITMRWFISGIVAGVSICVLVETVDLANTVTY